MARIRRLIDRITTPQPPHLLLLIALLTLGLNAADTQQLANATEIAAFLTAPYIAGRRPW